MTGTRIDGAETLNNLVALLRDALSAAERIQQVSSIDDAFPADGTEDEPEAEGGILMHAYWIGCSGLADAARALGVGRRIDRIGCSTEADLRDRVNCVGRDAYGSWDMSEGALIQRPGFERWIMQAIATSRSSCDPAITPRTRSIEVRLPAGLTRRQFDRALHEGLRAWALPDRHARYTKYAVGGDRLSRARELYTGLDPRRDGDRLLGIVETILVDHRRKTMSKTKNASALPKRIMFRQDFARSRHAKMKT